MESELRPLVRLSDSKMLSHLLSLEDWAPESYVATVEGLRWLTERTELRRELRHVKSLLPNLRLEPVKELVSG
jgi:predicted component of type VI protein secretion system